MTMAMTPAQTDLWLLHKPSHGNLLYSPFLPTNYNALLNWWLFCIWNSCRLAGSTEGELLASALPWQDIVFNAKHGGNKSTAICDMPPSGPVKMQPLFKIHPVLIQLGSDLQRLAASPLTFLYETLLKSHSLFLFLQCWFLFLFCL